jgi:hypothetical protein
MFVAGMLVLSCSMDVVVGPIFGAGILVLFCGWGYDSIGAVLFCGCGYDSCMYVHGWDIGAVLFCGCRYDSCAYVHGWDECDGQAYVCGCGWDISAIDVAVEPMFMAETLEDAAEQQP